MNREMIVTGILGGLLLAAPGAADAGLPQAFPTDAGAALAEARHAAKRMPPTAVGQTALPPAPDDDSGACFEAFMRRPPFPEIGIAASLLCPGTSDARAALSCYDAAVERGHDASLAGYLCSAVAAPDVPYSCYAPARRAGMSHIVAPGFCRAIRSPETATFCIEEAVRRGLAVSAAVGLCHKVR